MQGQRAGHDILFVDGIGDQLLGEFRGFPVGDHPTDDVAAENVENYVPERDRLPAGKAHAPHGAAILLRDANSGRAGRLSIAGASGFPETRRHSCRG
jgi:hypothetical protein